ncbi:hypothetical protein XFF6166_80086 [Xanthomonas citri pv. fuscans]|nr:hypothetical protein XFF6166_80086 [Xanthomonas citri pv. fuscans]SON99754.1 hypothetical protein XFF6960_200028 [Xanthomonas citri pv. fuscans]SOO03203.1 hypothetical protein XFF7767_150085 [Xanthomonas citri pv. fuscans]SOO09245.1 hypothetical protein XFF6970_330027 [Xanthomonas citri pv. fuscans]SOO15660.1 hypothetical protein XFF7766_600085 [Xanthomonas citri pv. fuscans]
MQCLATGSGLPLMRLHGRRQATAAMRDGRFDSRTCRCAGLPTQCRTTLRAGMAGGSMAASAAHAPSACAPCAPRMHGLRTQATQRMRNHKTAGCGNHIPTQSLKTRTRQRRRSSRTDQVATLEHVIDAPFPPRGPHPCCG